MNRHEFSALALDFMDEVAGFARRLTRHAADADDLVQATYERAFASWSTLSDPSACRVWLFRIAKNAHVDRARAATARPELRLVEPDDKLAPEPFVTADAVERIDARELEAALDRLPEEQREAVLLCDLWGFRYKEIASIVDCPVGTVRSRVARGRGHLAELLADTALERGKGGLGR